MPSTGNAPGRILVVDDQPANLRVVTALLNRQGYEVQSASDGDAALGLAAAQAPDLMLLDMMMPGMDGPAVCGRIKDHAVWRELPLIFLTAVDVPDQKVRALGAGAG